MTAQELLDKLNELPEELRTVPVHVETEEGGGELSQVRAMVAGDKLWWQADRIVLSARY